MLVVVLDNLVALIHLIRTGLGVGTSPSRGCPDHRSGRQRGPASLYRAASRGTSRLADAAPVDQIAPRNFAGTEGIMSKLQIIIGSTRPNTGRRQGRPLGDRPRNVPPGV